jgi:DNA topoisomerase-1
VVGLLEKHFGSLVDYEFTARMEEDLDRIARGEAEQVPWLKRFYFGDGDALEGLKALVTDLGEIDAREVNTFPIGDGIALRVGKYGPYVEKIGPDGTAVARANVPEDTAPDELTPEFAEELFSRPSGDRELGVDPATGYTIVAKAGRYGPYVTEILPEGTPKTGKNAVKPRTGSLFKDMSLDDVDLPTALKLMSLPRTVGVDPSTNEEITAQNGRYGPYLKRGTDSRSLADEDQIFSITLDEALVIYAQPKARGGRGSAQPPLREFGADPVSGKPITVRDGRFGPYITDGETNITVPRGTTVEELTQERAVELLAEKRAKGPAPKKRAAAKKSAPAKKASTAKKTATAKSAAKKTAPSSPSS